LAAGPPIGDDPRAVLARIHIDARCAASLVCALVDAACLIVGRHDETVDVLVTSSNGDDQARMELAFFLRAWALDHPQAGVRLGRLS
jgi:hypothetical protein